MLRIHLLALIAVGALGFCYLAVCLLMTILVVRVVIVLDRIREVLR